MRPDCCDRCGEATGEDSLLVAPGRVWCSTCAVRGGVELLTHFAGEIEAKRRAGRVFARKGRLAESHGTAEEQRPGGPV